MSRLEPKVVRWRRVCSRLGFFTAPLFGWYGRKSFAIKMLGPRAGGFDRAPDRPNVDLRRHVRQAAPRRSAHGRRRWVARIGCIHVIQK